MTIERQDIEDLRYAKSLLEGESFAIKATSIIGKPIEFGLDSLPDGANNLISTATTKALSVSLKAAVTTMSKKPSTSSWDKLHKLACATTGGAGGFFGLSALAIELPCSTTIMLRSIADIARSEGALITSTEIELECVSIFALGGPSPDDDAAESGYYAIRAALSEAVTNAANYIAKEGLKKEGAPIIVKLIAEIASRFSVQVSQKTVVQAIPVIGAASGALINTIFIDHFQDKARGHFIIRRLERKYSVEAIREEYKKI
ncbi:MAG: EcsC family protein [Campylobacterota bacterium]|nr:EcsC family protein [Campylobacterota bacterium]